ncbi:MAG: hypothetical protein Unbinned1469contig1000_12 [Prokaryotic dsDNA virus sp.]|jgi:hypothetical protein|nr:MAG: hypothetical protein Unbinned1469contig1000_12 [Prokaryotic dsDNA virus sp.]|tara:strand:+ start:60 stop:401 length:342 start_codon:yes stop_codon:yes gene_type:complete
MDILNVNNLANIASVEEKEIEIPELKAKVVIRGLTKKMQVDLARITQDETKDAFDYQKALLKVSVVNPVLDDEAIDKLYELDAQIVDMIFIEISNLNGIGEDEQTEMSDEFQK